MKPIDLGALVGAYASVALGNKTPPSPAQVTTMVGIAQKIMAGQTVTSTDFPQGTFPIDLAATLTLFEDLIVALCFNQNNGNVSRTGKMLGIQRSTLSLKLERMRKRGLLPPRT